MSAVLPFVKIDSDSLLAEYFTQYQICWIHAEDSFHEAKKQVFALAEKSVRIGWTFCDGFKNVRKRLQFKNRDYLFVTRDWTSALEYMNQVYKFAEMMGYTRAVLSHGENIVRVPKREIDGSIGSVTEDVRVGEIKFDNGSRILAFSSNPYAMAVYGGDVGIDEFAKHPNPKALWQTAQGRVTWNYDLAVWSSHDGENTLFNQFAQQARQACAPASDANASSALPQKPSLKNGSPWNLYFRVTMPDAVELGLLDIMNLTTGANATPEQFLADCQARAGSDEIYQQSYLCNPQGAEAAYVVEWSAIEHCRFDYPFERLHLEADDIRSRFFQFTPGNAERRQDKINTFILEKFPVLFGSKKPDPSSYCPGSLPDPKPQLNLGFDVAASGQGDLAAIYIDEFKRPNYWARALLTLRTEDWHFIAAALFCFLDNLNCHAAGDESGLGRQLCWEASSEFGSRFLKVNFAAKKSDLGFSLMNQLATAEKRFPRSEQDIAGDFFALRKSYTGTRWAFSEGRNTFNPASHCDIAWAAALSTYAYTNQLERPWAMVC